MGSEMENVTVTWKVVGGRKRERVVKRIPSIVLAELWVL